MDFQRELATTGIQLPNMFITGHGDILMWVKAMKREAVEFLTKPLRDQDLLVAVALALARDRSQRQEEKALAGLKARFEVVIRASARS